MTKANHLMYMYLPECDSYYIIRKGLEIVESLEFCHSIEITFKEYMEGKRKQANDKSNDNKGSGR